jgi:hypothetical protein
VDDEILLQARRQAALLHSLGMPSAAAEIEAYCEQVLSGTQPARQDDYDDETFSLAG